MSLKAISTAAVARRAWNELVELFEFSPDPLRDVTSHIDSEKGTVTLDGTTFTYNGRLVMLGYCPVCSQEVPSTPIRTLADIGAQLAAFRPGKHECIDV